MNITVDLDLLLKELLGHCNFVYASRAFAESLKLQAGDLIVVKDIAENPLSSGMYIYSPDGWRKEQEMLSRLKFDSYIRDQTLKIQKATEETWKPKKKLDKQLRKTLFQMP